MRPSRYRRSRLFAECPDARYAGQSGGCATGEISSRSEAEYKQVTAIANGPGSSLCGTLSSGQPCLTITPPLEHNNWRASQNPAVNWTDSVVNSFGSENLTLDSSQDGNNEDAAIQFQNTENCWMRNMRVLDAGDSFVFAAYNNLRLDIVAPRTTIKVTGVSVAAYNGTFQVDCVYGSASNPGGCPALSANQITYGLVVSLPGNGSGG